MMNGTRTTKKTCPTLIGTALSLLIFGYAVYNNFQMTRIITNSGGGSSSNLWMINDLQMKKKMYATASTKRNIIDVETIAKTMVQSFSATARSSTGGTAGTTIDEYGDDTFEMSFAHPHDEKRNCRCDLISVDCLNTISCIQHENPQYQHAHVWIGLELRKAMIETSKIRGEAQGNFYLPLGKNLQYTSMDTWRSWRYRNTLPRRYATPYRSIFVNPDWYPECSKNRYRGTSCFYQGIVDGEDSEGTILEEDSVRWFEQNYDDDSASTISRSQNATTKHIIQNTLREFFKEQQSENLLSRRKRFDNNGNDDEAQSSVETLSALGNLILFAHITRMMFNRRPFLDEIYQSHLKSIAAPAPTGQPMANKEEEGKGDLLDPFIIGLHIRRGDSCSFRSPEHYEKKSSPLNSSAQFGSYRLCYTTNVYLDAVRRIRKLVPPARPIHVYLATDDVGNILNEILHRKNERRRRRMKSQNNNNKNVSDVVVEVPVDRWYYLNYSRSHFNYVAESIEADENENQHILGETAVADLWLLSHSHAYVGHLGSRFGKVAFLLAAARHNSFIPFFSVDGHSFCCEIDEDCGETKPYIINMENCLTFGHEYRGFDHKGKYFEAGSLARKIIHLEKTQRRGIG